jgi:hypothetical protein
VPAAPPSRKELLKDMGKKSAVSPGVHPKAATADDDFIDIDDKKAFKKSWPMALFLGLIALAAGWI